MNSPQRYKNLKRLSVLTVVALTMSFGISWAQSGLVEGRDYFLVAAGDSVTAQVPSVLMTRDAMDELLNEVQFLREKNSANERALTAATDMLETRDSLEVLLAEERKNRWFVPILTGAGSFLGGYLAGQAGTDTVVIR